MTEMIKQTVFKYLTGFQLVMAIFFFLISTYGMPEDEYEMVVFVVVAAVAAFVYAKDKNTGVELKKVDLTPQQEYNIKSVFEWVCELLGLKATIEGIPDEESPALVIPNISEVSDELLLKELKRRTKTDG